MLDPRWKGVKHHPECSSVVGPAFQWCDCKSLPQMIAFRTPWPAADGVLAKLDEGARVRRSERGMRAQRTTRTTTHHFVTVEFTPAEADQVKRDLQVALRRT